MDCPVRRRATQVLPTPLFPRMTTLKEGPLGSSHNTMPASCPSTEAIFRQPAPFRSANFRFRLRASLSLNCLSLTFGQTSCFSLTFGRLLLSGSLSVKPFVFHSLSVKRLLFRPLSIRRLLFRSLSVRFLVFGSLSVRPLVFGTLSVRPLLLRSLSVRPLLFGSLSVLADFCSTHFQSVLFCSAYYQFILFHTVRVRPRSLSARYFPVRSLPAPVFLPFKLKQRFLWLAVRFRPKMRAPFQKKKVFSNRRCPNCPFCGFILA